MCARITILDKLDIIKKEKKNFGALKNGGNNQLTKWKKYLENMYRVINLYKKYMKDYTN